MNTTWHLELRFKEYHGKIKSIRFPKLSREPRYGEHPQPAEEIITTGD